MVYNKIIWIHRMAAILSDLLNKVNIPELKEKITDAYATINDKIGKLKDVLSDKVEGKKSEEKKPEETKPEEGKKEDYAAAPPSGPKTTKEKVIDFLIKLKDYFIMVAIFLLKVSFYVFLASLVANDMMMYAPTIRAFFFVFTLIVTYMFTPYAFFLTCYFLLRKGYDYYHYNLSSEEVKPPRSFPMIFAILPLTTYYPESSIARFFMWAFMYQKSSKPEKLQKENDRLEIIMTEYWKDLNKSFDYLNKIKTKEPFSRLYELNEEHLTVNYMHPIKKPETVVEPSKTLPPVIGEEKKSTEPKKQVMFYPPMGSTQLNKIDEIKESAEKITEPTPSSENNMIVATAVAEVAKQPS